MGRHSTDRHGWRLTSPVPLLSMLLVVMLTAWGSFVFLREQLAGEGCTVPTTLRVATATGIAPAVSGIARGRADQDRPDCYRVRVVPTNSTDVAEALAGSKNSNFDVWIPESSMWLRLARNRGAFKIPEAGQSIASSPVVLAMTPAVADKLASKRKPPSMAAVFGAEAEQVTAGMPAPGRNPAGLATLLGIKALSQDAANPDSAFTQTTRKLSDHVVAESAELFDRLPGTNSAQNPIEAFPAPESAVLRYNAKHAGRNLVMSYPDAGVPSLDYPYVVLPGTSQEVTSAAERFLAELLAPSATATFVSAGFRSPGGKFPEASWSQTPRQLAPKPVRPARNTLAIRDVLRTWAGVNRSASIHVLLDISGSMAQRVGSTGKTRLQLTVQAALQGMGLFKSTTEIELWLFSTNLANGKDYRTLLPMRTVNEQIRAGAIQKMKAVRPKPYGGTGLYDSVLAAYESATRGFEPGKLNLVIALTDGQNSDSESISLDTLLTKLRKLHDPRKPIPVIGIGIGPNINPSELRAIAKATSGQTFTATDPSKISRVFYKALSEIICKSPGCKA